MNKLAVHQSRHVFLNRKRATLYFRPMDIILSGAMGRVFGMMTNGLKRLPPGILGRNENYFAVCFYAHHSMSHFHILEHTADVGFEAFGSTLVEVFENAARALAHLIADPATVQPVDEIRIEVQGTDPPDLLVDWLSEILFQHDAERRLFRDFRVERLDDHAVSGLAWGEKNDPARHRTNLMVKAITYHQLGLEQTAGGWRAQVYVDI